MNYGGLNMFEKKKTFNGHHSCFQQSTVDLIMIDSYDFANPLQILGQF